MSTPVTNFGKATVSTGYSSAATSIVLTTGHGSRFPSTFPYPLTWWNATDYPDPADDPDREIVIVTARTGDTLTVTRAGESTSATNKNTGGKTYKMILSITKAMWENLSDLSLSQTFRGLTMSTHPDSDVDDKKVVLLHADAIVMDNGEEVSNWNDVVADITASGIGGLDTGTEQASTWYSIIAMWNGTTKALQLHREKNYFLDEDINAAVTEDATQGCRSAVDNSTIKVSQGFQLSTAGFIEFVDVKLIKAGTPTGNFWFTLEANNGGVPSNTPLATSDKLDVSRMTTTATWVRIPFRTPYSFSSATTYHLVLQGDYTVSATNYLGWRMDGSAAAYANGSKALYDSDTTTWTTDTDDDMLAKIYVTENDTSVTLNGYTNYAKIGYVYNDSGSNFKHFHQSDRTVCCGYDDSWQVGALTSTTPALIDTAAFLPPIPHSVELLAYNGTACSLVFGTLECTDLVSTITTELIGVTRHQLNTAYASAIGKMALSEYQGLMYLTSAGTLNLYISVFEF